MDESPAEKVKRLMREHGIDKRLEEKKIEGPLVPAPEDERQIGTDKQKPLSKIRGVITDAKAHEKRITPPEKDDSSE